MEPLQRDSFEREWAHAFENARTEPSDALWDKLESDLNASENKKLKRSLLFTRWVAAASIVMAAFIGGLSYSWYNNSSNDSNISELSMNSDFVEEPVSESANSIPENPANSNSAIDASVNQNLTQSGTVESSAVQATNSISDKINSQPIAETQSTQNRESSTNNNLAFAEAGKEGGAKNRVKRAAFVTGTLEETGKEKSLLSGNSDGKSIFFLIPKENAVSADAGLGAIAGLGLSDVERNAFPELEGVDGLIITLQKPLAEKERMWAGLSMGGGSYNSTGISPALMSANAIEYSPDLSQNESPYYRSNLDGNTQSAGISAGKRISKRISLSGGVQYSSIQSGFYQGNDPMLRTENTAAAINSFSNKSSSDPGYLQEDRFHFVNIPARIGINIIDRRFGMAVLSGIDSRLLMGSNSNEYVNGSTTYNVVKRDINPVTFWGGVSTEFTFDINEYYRLSLVPGYRVAINELEKGSGEHPRLLDIGLGLRYQFR